LLGHPPAGCWGVAGCFPPPPFLRVGGVGLADPLPPPPLGVCFVFWECGFYFFFGPTPFNFYSSFYSKGIWVLLPPFCTSDHPCVFVVKQFCPVFLSPLGVFLCLFFFFFPCFLYFWGDWVAPSTQKKPFVRVSPVVFYKFFFPQKKNPTQNYPPGVGSLLFVVSSGGTPPLFGNGGGKHSGWGGPFVRWF